MDSLIFELQIIFYFQFFLSANVRHSFLSSVSTDGKDWHGLKLENIGPTFSNFIAMAAQITKILLWLVFPDESCLISSS